MTGQPPRSDRGQPVIGAPRFLHVNGRLLPEAEARVSALDRGLLFGDGVFETLRAYGGRVFRLSRHLERLARSLQAVGLDWPIDAGRVRGEIDALLAANQLSEARVRLTVTGGPFDGPIRLKRTGSPTVLLMASPIRPPDAAVYAEGVDLRIATFHQAWSSPLARVKTIHRLEYLMAREEAIAHGAWDSLILDDRSGLAETSSGNIFLVIGGAVVTPSLDEPILPGVTREAVLEAARSCGVGTGERHVGAGEIWTADEIFVTATSWEVLAVRTVDGRSVGSGGRGPVTALIHDAYRALVKRETSAG